jgi:hypothetical protein
MESGGVIEYPLLIKNSTILPYQALDACFIPHNAFRDVHMLRMIFTLKTQWLIHVNFSIQLPMKKCILHIHLP